LLGADLSFGIDCEYGMNERIMELAEQARINVSQKNYGYYWVESADGIEKFAELIVKECAQVCRDQPNHYALKADRDNCAIAIEEHFGVEE
jgi:hypothetical protein